MNVAVDNGAADAAVASDADVVKRMLESTSE